MFEPGLKIGQIIKNNDIVEIFKCGNMGGMRRSKATNTLVIISDYTKGIYHDKWIGDVLHYTGMGKTGNQDIGRAQNATLAAAGRSDIDVHLFEVINAGEYIYCGRIELAGEPYIDIQAGEDGLKRKVWIFPIRPVSGNDVEKPSMFVFKDMDDYNMRGKTVDVEYMKMISGQKKSDKDTLKKPAAQISSTLPAAQIHENIDLSAIEGKRVKHKFYGEGTIVAVPSSADAIIVVAFNSFGEKKFDYGYCIENRLIEFI